MWNNVRLSWTTATETNNFGFNVQRKNETTDWQKIEFVHGQGTTLQPAYYKFSDTSVPNGKYEYRLKQIDTDGSFEYSQILSVTVVGPVTTRLAQNYPNPFNPATNIIYSIEEDGFVQVKIYDVLGSSVRTLIDKNQTAGEYSIAWDGRNTQGYLVSGGVYFYVLKVGNLTIAHKRMIFIK